jgi:hypothetical protein
MECIEGLRTPDRGTISVLGLNPFMEGPRLGALAPRFQCQLRLLGLSGQRFHGSPDRRL